MITYTYKREDGKYFEVEQSIKDDPLEECPKTGQSCERVIKNAENVLIMFKGTGFHSTDYDEDVNCYDDDIMQNKSDDSIDTHSYK